ncbi:putative disease resistance RPP13-like protein 1 [Dioscorea cayenensis subsp. rotundata]|uniref:Disease resistance RPP13-like protein 1 n=1 Tax=Dioscorea cayennensis subsp. rotundata TaxID=55577 RepID=A0AB40CWE2_DIOCR|nr:putative disease resistance RPP13-like protein 1 [Dioscorea cayenensis subsp. rotundata]
MVSPILSGIAGAILAPILPQFALNKLLDSLFEYLSRDVDNKLKQQLENELKAFAEANRKLEIIQSEARRFHKRDKQNMRLIHINNKLRDVSLQIKDLKDDLEYRELQREVEINLPDEVADKGSSTTRQLRSLIPWAIGQSSDKRRRLSSSESIDVIVNKMRTIIEQINCIDLEMNNAIKLDAWSKIEVSLKGGYDSSGRHQLEENKGVTTSSPTHESETYRRDIELSQLIQLLLIEPNVSGKVSVVPIIGMGDMGKTTLAQSAFNNTEITNHFGKKAWICVSDNFARFRITKEILDSLSMGDGSSSAVPFGITTNLDVLEREIKRQVKGKKFLLVLDDVWCEEWQELRNFLQSTQAKTIKLIVTCRDPKILGVSSNGGNQITLKDLSSTTT